MLRKIILIKVAQEKKYKKSMKLIKFYPILKNEMNMINSLPDQLLKITIKIPHKNNTNKISKINNNGMVHIKIHIWVPFLKNLSNNKENISNDKKTNNKNKVASNLQEKSLIKFIKIDMVILIMKKFIKIIDSKNKNIINRKI